MKKFVFVLFLALPFAGVGQGVPDNDHIVSEIFKSGSPYFYPSLMLRYEAGDTTLTLKDYHYLYYGFAYQDEYRPLEPVQGESDLLMILERNPEGTSLRDADEIVGAAKRIFERDPFSPRNINFMTYAYLIAGDTVNAKINADRFDKIIKTIEASGDGLKEGTAWHVLWFSHVNDFLGAKELDIQKRFVQSRSVEYVLLTKKDGNNKGYFFDYSRVYWKKPTDADTRRRVDGFKINGINVGRKKHPLED